MRRKLQMKKKNISVKYLACGDLHITNKQPRYRCDNYWETIQHKLKFIIDTANERDAQILIAGDIFDSSRMGYEVTNIIISMFHEAHKIPLCIAGQHDLKYHTDLDKCPLYTLALAGAVKIIDGVFENIAGAGFGDPIPEDKAQILITHTTITESTPPFFLEDAIPAKKFMRMNPQFEIIVSGDYHVPFVKRLGKQVLINTGTLIRNKKDMHGYVPYIWEIIIDDGVVIEQVEVPHEPYSKVFDLEGIEYDKDHGITIDTERLKELIDSGIDNNDLDSIVWTLFRELTEQGHPINKELTKEVLTQCK